MNQKQIDYRLEYEELKNTGHYVRKWRNSRGLVDWFRNRMLDVFLTGKSAVRAFVTEIKGY